MTQLVVGWPLKYQTDEAPAAAKAWGWFGLPAAGEGSEFDAAAAPWVYDFSSVTGFYMMTGEPPIVGGSIPQLRMQMGMGL